MSDQQELEFYNTKKLAALLAVTPKWLVRNRNSKNPIPYLKLGRIVRYKRSDVIEWIGKKNLELKFCSTQTLAKKLDLKVDWLKRNRLSSNPIPFKKFGGLVRYQLDEAMHWFKKNNSKKGLYL